MANTKIIWIGNHPHLDILYKHHQKVTELDTLREHTEYINVVVIKVFWLSMKIIRFSFSHILFFDRQTPNTYIIVKKMHILRFVISKHCKSLFSFLHFYSVIVKHSKSSCLDLQKYFVITSSSNIMLFDCQTLLKVMCSYSQIVFCGWKSLHLWSTHMNFTSLHSGSWSRCSNIFISDTILILSRVQEQPGLRTRVLPTVGAARGCLVRTQL